MRKAILNENKQVIGFEPMQEEMSEQAKEHYKKQVEFVQKKYGLKVDKQSTLCYNNSIKRKGKGIKNEN